MESNSPDIVNTYGWVLVKAGEPRKGLPLLEKAKALKPDIYCIDLHLGVVYCEMGEEDRAIEYLKRQIKRNADDRWGQSARTVLQQMGWSEG
jgi:Tfp pilus assembly protein PilF